MDDTGWQWQPFPTVHDPAPPLTLLDPYELSSDAGSYEVTGADATFERTYVLSADAGAYSVSGSDATLLATRTLALDAGGYSVNGADATLVYTQVGSTYTLNAGAGAYDVTGGPVTFVHFVPQPAGNGGGGGGFGIGHGRGRGKIGAFKPLGLDAKSQSPRSLQSEAPQKKGAKLGEDWADIMDFKDLI